VKPNRYLHLGVREHAMAAILTASRTRSGLIPMAAPSWSSPVTLVGAMRLNAALRTRVIYVLTTTNSESALRRKTAPTHQAGENARPLR